MIRGQPSQQVAERGDRRYPVSCGKAVLGGPPSWSNYSLIRPDVTDLAGGENLLQVDRGAMPRFIRNRRFCYLVVAAEGNFTNCDEGVECVHRFSLGNPLYYSHEEASSGGAARRSRLRIASCQTARIPWNYAKLWPRYGVVCLKRVHSENAARELLSAFLLASLSVVAVWPLARRCVCGQLTSQWRDFASDRDWLTKRATHCVRVRFSHPREDCCRYADDRPVYIRTFVSDFDLHSKTNVGFLQLKVS